jgi:hypothetical protein
MLCFSAIYHGTSLGLYIHLYIKPCYNSGMEKPSELASSSPSLADLVNGEELIRSITKTAHSRRTRRPVLEACSFRIEVDTHGKLKEAAKKLDPITQSDIMNGLLEIFLPLILAQRASAGEKVLADPDQRAQLAGLLQSLSLLLQKDRLSDR